MGRTTGPASARVGYAGTIAWDTTRPDGTPRKLLDISPLRATGWTPTIDLREGIMTTLAWYREHVAGTETVNRP